MPKHVLIKVIYFIVSNHLASQVSEANNSSLIDQKQIEDMEKNILPKLLYDYLKETSLEAAIKEKQNMIEKWSNNIKEAEKVIKKVYTIFVFNLLFIHSQKNR